VARKKLYNFLKNGFQYINDKFEWVLENAVDEEPVKVLERLHGDQVEVYVTRIGDDDFSSAGDDSGGESE